MRLESTRDKGNSTVAGGSLLLYEG
ncbi:hypothetical protein RHECNPAF_9300113 [Rhizobium etli CNPAF512]|nr:hypothetical protein RHECNPAF_9300113 [Rhizobium etli CNPAF512]